MRLIKSVPLRTPLQELRLYIRPWDWRNTYSPDKTEGICPSSISPLLQAPFGNHAQVGTLTNADNYNVKHFGGTLISEVVGAYVRPQLFSYFYLSRISSQTSRYISGPFIYPAPLASRGFTEIGYVPKSRVIFKKNRWCPFCFSLFYNILFT